MNEARVYADGFERSFAEVKDLLEFLAERGRNAKWIRKPTNTLRLAPLEKEAQNLDAADASMEEILEDTEKNTQLVLKMRGESYPVRDCAIRTILSRAGVNGDGLRKLDKATYAKVVNYCLRVAKGDALIKIADGKVSAVHGGDKHDYCILDMKAMFETTCEYLNLNFKGSVYMEGSGIYDHSIVSAMWKLGGSQELLDTYRKALDAHGMDEKILSPALRFTTSDVAASGANLYPMLLTGIQITISIWEMWMCYEILYMTVLDKKYADKKETIIRWANIFVVGSLLGINRLIAFFSRTMLGLVVILTIMCMYGIKRKKVVLSAGIVFVYFEFIAILDFILAFISMEFIKEQFEHVIYIYALTWQKVLIYFFTRGIILLGIVNIKKREESIRSMIEQCCGIIVITGALLCAVLFKYQLWLDEMANGSKPIRGINASMNLSAISLLIVLSGMFIIKYQVVKQEKTTLILRDQLLEERYAEMLKSRQMIHDMKNHLLVLRNMERANQWDKLHDYLEEISKDILDDSTKIWTGNNIVDLILNSKKKQADSEGIAFSIGSNMIGDVPFKDGETISLLGNLLDNAIEACERIKSTEKWVTIRINRRYCLLYIEIENSIEEHPKEKNHRLISCKSEKEVHGYGLKNVRQIVDRYDGTYSYQIKENSFLTCVSFFSNEDVS